MRIFKDMHDAAKYMKELIRKEEMNSFYGSYSFIQNENLRLIGEHNGWEITIKFYDIGYHKHYETPEYEWVDNEMIFKQAIIKLRNENRRDLATKLYNRYRAGHFTAKQTPDDWQIAFALVYCGALYTIMPDEKKPGEKLEVSKQSYVIADYVYRMWRVHPINV